MQRTDLSPYLVHLTRDAPGAAPARQNLISILKNRLLEARNPHGIARAHLEHMGWRGEEWTATQRAVCFSETPLESLPALLNPGIWRGVRLRPYGLFFERGWVIVERGTPVWYLPQYPTQKGQWLVRDVNALIDEAATREGKPDPHAFACSRIARLTPFMEALGVWQTERGTTRRKEFDFEREWRVVGDLRFDLEDVQGIVTSWDDADALRGDLVAEGVDSETVLKLEIWEVGDTEVRKGVP